MSIYDILILFFWLNAKIISPLGDLTYIDKATNNFKGGNHDSST